eukprot:TRINITY_DN63793_c0_g1_i1.p2 TRINITY_DN63793_c0_g1~~TRINITY_DN63793_c0_g1_i1.p2  ORF type:complete len:129 (-),score=40.76 TRINITY_DN63793_c0_g1_i1:105-491(-)
MSFDVGYCFQVMMQCIDDPEFAHVRRVFEREHCREFEDQEENKLSYTIIHQQYMQLIELWIEGRMAQVIPDFTMEAFLPELQEFLQCGGATKSDTKKVMELLNASTDFFSFKEMMLDASFQIFAEIDC